MSILICLLTASLAFAHANLIADTALAPRSADTGLKVAPCGGIARTNTPKIIQSGSTINIEWQETINHPGRFEFSLSQAGDRDFQLLKKVVDTQDDPIVGNNYHKYSTTISFPPGVSCKECTLQMVQVMTENPTSPSYYYSCADLQLVGTSSVITPTPAAPGASSGSSCTP